MLYPTVAVDHLQAPANATKDGIPATIDDGMPAPARRRHSRSVVPADAGDVDGVTDGILLEAIGIPAHGVPETGNPKPFRMRVRPRSAC